MTEDQTVVSLDIQRMRRRSAGRIGGRGLTTRTFENLCEIATLLEIPVRDFFEPSVDHLSEPFSSLEMLELIELYFRIDTQDKRNALLAAARTAAGMTKDQ